MTSKWTKLFDQIPNENAVPLRGIADKATADFLIDILSDGDLHFSTASPLRKQFFIETDGEITATYDPFYTVDCSMMMEE